MAKKFQCLAFSILMGFCLQVEAGEMKKEQRELPEIIKQCFDQIGKEFPKEEVEKLKSESRDNLSKYHHGLGRWLRNNCRVTPEQMAQMTGKDKDLFLHKDSRSSELTEIYWDYLNGKL